LTRLALPDNQGRVDTGVAQGLAVSPHYDPMIAKLIAHAPTRDEARIRLEAMVERVECWPVKTNAAFLAKALADEDFAAGQVDTGLIARKGDAWMPLGEPSQAALQAVARRTLTGPVLPGAWQVQGLRANAEAVPTVVRLAQGDRLYPVTLSPTPSTVPVLKQGHGWLVSEGGETFHLTPWRPAAGEGAAGSGAIEAPMPGLVIAVFVEPGESVRKGQKLLTLEAMKMEQALLAPFDGVVTALSARVGQQVAADALLARIEVKAEGDA
jgi:3-methylcrotonyl-CoA carboxylase alpha subunit